MLKRRNPMIAASALLMCVGVASAQEHEPDPEAMAAFQAVVDAYRARPALSVVGNVTVAMGEGELTSTGPNAEARMTFDDKGRGVFSIRGFTCYIGDGMVSAVHEETEQAYFSMPDDDSAYYMLMNMFFDLPFPHLAFAFGEPDLDDLIMQFHPKAPWAKPTGVRDDLYDDVTVQVITFSSDYERMDVAVDPDTKLLQYVDLEITGGYLVQDGTSMRYRNEFEYEFHDEPLPDSFFVFDPGERQRVDMLGSLEPAPVAAQGGAPAQAQPGALVGKAAPGFILESLDGEVVDLEDLQGQVVILDFWASWCGPCMVALPGLHEVAVWAKDEQLPVTVLTVNVWEGMQLEVDSPDARKEVAEATWTQRNFTLPVVMDYTDETAGDYGVTGIPATFIIRSDGVVHEQHSGAGPNYVDDLKAEILAALAALEAPQNPDE